MSVLKKNIDLVWANDINKDACETYKLNIGNHIKCGDIDNYKDELYNLKKYQYCIWRSTMSRVLCRR